MARGGYREAKPGQVPGPGKSSGRVDANEIVNMDNPDIQSGDVQRLLDSQKQNPIQSRPTPQPRPTAQPAQRGRPPGQQGLPSFLFEGSNRPTEPTTAGLDLGPGMGSEMLQ